MLFVVSILCLQSCGSDYDGSPRFKDSEEVEIRETTQGVISEIEELEPGDKYTVLNEEVIDDRTNSLAIVHNLDQTIDTLTFAKMVNGDYGSRSNLRPFLLGTLAATYLTRGFRSSSLNKGSYKNPDSFNKSKGLRNNMMSSATTRKVRVPGKGSKGYGGKRSFRSFGG